MSKPEIARRCQSCGASIRDLAFFCPQCGKALKTTGELTKLDPEADKPATAVATAPLNEAPKQQKQLPAASSADKPARKPKLETPKPPEPTGKDLAGRPPGTPDPAGQAMGTASAQGSATAPGKAQRAASLVGNVGSDVVQRGQRLREMSTVVWDEAAYDPSLRFVLVAAALFLLFLIIVLLNRFIV